jgi:hypothetical protein
VANNGSTAETVFGRHGVVKKILWIALTLPKLASLFDTGDWADFGTLSVSASIREIRVKNPV